MIQILAVSMLLISTGWGDDNSLLQLDSDVCAITKQVVRNDGKYMIILNETRAGRTLIISSVGWSAPKASRLPYMALKAGSAVLSDSALSIEKTSEEFGPGLIFELTESRGEIHRLIRDNNLSIWDAREPKRLLDISAGFSERTLDRWQDCGAKLDGTVFSDPFRR